jgi:hypothetical protein
MSWSSTGLLLILKIGLGSTKGPTCRKETSDVEDATSAYKRL